MIYKKNILIKFSKLRVLDGQSLDQVNNKNLGQLYNYDQSKYQRIIGMITFDQKYA